MMRTLAAAVLFFTSVSALKAVAANDSTALATASKPAIGAPAAQGGFNCFDLRKAAQKLPVYAANIQNHETTRTAEGGPYKRVDVICREMFCETSAKEDFKLVVDRQHPDANSAGYVRYPVINVANQFAALSSAASEIRLLASTGVCGASAISGADMALIKYEAGGSIQSDTFNYGSDGRLNSWSRVLRDGTSENLAFNADGTTAKN